MESEEKFISFVKLSNISQSIDFIELQEPIDKSCIKCFLHYLGVKACIKDIWKGIGRDKKKNEKFHKIANYSFSFGLFFKIHDCIELQMFVPYCLYRQ